MSKIKDVYLSSKLLLDASNLLLPYYPEISSTILALSEKLASSIKAEVDPEVERYSNILSKTLGESVNIDTVYADNYSKHERNIKRENFSQPKEVMDTLFTIRNRVIEKLQNEAATGGK